MKKIWFKAKRWGYGWYPATWQGWLIILVYLVIVVGGALTIDTSEPNVKDGAGIFLIVDALATITLIIVCAKYGEPAKWRWGKKDDDINPDEHKTPDQK